MKRILTIVTLSLCVVFGGIFSGCTYNKISDVQGTWEMIKDEEDASYYAFESAKITVADTQMHMR